MPLKHNRDYLMWFVATAASALGSATASIALPLVAAKAGSGSAGVTVGAFYLAYAGGLVPAGLIADRFDRRRAVVLCSVVQALNAGVVCFAVVREAATPVLLSLSALVGGLTMALFNAESNPVLGRLVDETQVSMAMARLQSRRAVVQLIGPVLGGALFGFLAWLPFALDALSFLVVVAAAATFATDLGPDRHDVSAEAATSFASRASAGFRFLVRHRVLRLMAGLASVLNIVFFALFLLIILLARSRGGSALEIGVNEGIAGAGLLLGSFAAPPLARRYRNGHVVLVVALAACAGSTYLMTVGGPVWVIGAAMACISGCLVVVNVYLQTYEMQEVPDNIRGRTSAALQAISAGLQWIGPLVVGVAAAASGEVAVADAVAAILGVSAVGLALAVPLRALRLAEQS